mgnify:CR=1 FL=1
MSVSYGQLYLIQAAAYHTSSQHYYGLLSALHPRLGRLHGPRHVRPLRSARRPAGWSLQGMLSQIIRTI